jgi:hypothetical protein
MLPLTVIVFWLQKIQDPPSVPVAAVEEAEQPVATSVTVTWYVPGTLTVGEELEPFALTFPKLFKTVVLYDTEEFECKIISRFVSVVPHGRSNMLFTVKSGSGFSLTLTEQLVEGPPAFVMKTV